MNTDDTTTRSLRLARIAAGSTVVLGVAIAWIDALLRGRGDASTTMTMLALVLAAWAVELSGVRWPRPAFIVAAVVPAMYLHSVPQVAYIPLLVLPVVGWLGYTSRRRWGLLALAVALINIIPYVAENGTLALPWTVATFFTWLAARGFASQERLLQELRAAQADLAKQAAETERRRIAGEIHDVMAHSLAVMVLHLTGARMLLQKDGADPRAIAAIAEAETQGRQSLDDVRRTIGVLRDERSSPTAAPLPKAMDLPVLIGQYRSAGLDVTLTVEGALSSLPPTTGLALYRIVQEALANAVKHAPGQPASVHLEIADGVRLRIRNDLAKEEAGTEGNGLGVAGMRDRAALLGGTLTAGPPPDGWIVECHLPGAGPSEAPTIPETVPEVVAS